MRVNNNLLNSYKFIDLFAGIGGFRIAFEKFGAKCVFSSEWDKFAQRTYEANFNEKPFGDITRIEANEIPKHDILCGGFPCQAFSISGKQKGFEDTRGTLFFDVARIVEYHKPKLLFLENVRNFEKHDNGKTLLVVKKTLDDLGYKVFHKVLNASHFGLPQNRERIFIIGIHESLGVDKFTFPKPPNLPVALKDILLSDYEVKEFIIKRDDISIMEEKLAVGDLPHFPLLRPHRVGTINKGGQGERIYSTEGHAVTLSAYGGGAGAKTGAYLVNGVVRKLSPRECARIQGFPDTFVIPVSNSQAWKQFGNSVPIKVLEYIIEELINQKILKPKDLILN